MSQHAPSSSTTLYHHAAAGFYATNVITIESYWAIGWGSFEDSLKPHNVKSGNCRTPIF